MKRTYIILTGIAATSLLIVVGVVFFLNQDKTSSKGQKKTPHFLDSTPLHNETYAAQPINVTINFDFDLSDKSRVSVTDKSGKEWSEGEVLIEDSKTALKRMLKGEMLNGEYLVKYTACWPDDSCHEGNFSFTIDFSKKASYKDLRGQTEVAIEMKDIKFGEDKVIISPGTKVVWVNQDSVGHFVNTETHPEHTYFPQQNSRELTQGQTFSQIFTTLGQYNYHCSAHASTMSASLIVSN
ncbi:MAG: plastocyanin/azurin family copper-binding protein [bacterium]|nr:plastocyanin/azurin family copper-binding protein [bacterium]